MKNFIAALVIAFSLQPSLTQAEVKLFKDIKSGVNFSEILSRPLYYDCSESGISIACLDGQYFLKTEGTVAVLFENELSIKVLFLSDSLSLYQNAIARFTNGDYSLVGVETSSGMFDILNAAKTESPSIAIAKAGEIAMAGLSQGFLTYYFFESPASSLRNYKNIVDFAMKLPSGKRVITIAVSEDDYGNVETVVSFELNVTDYRAMQLHNQLLPPEDF